MPEAGTTDIQNERIKGKRNMYINSMCESFQILLISIGERE